MTETTDVFDRQPVAGPGRGRNDNRPPSSNLVVVAAAALISVIVVIVLILALLGDDDTPIDTTDTSTTTSTTESTTTESTASTSTEPTTSSLDTSTTVETTTSTTASTSTETTTLTSTTVDPETYRSAVWPWLDSSVRYADPVGAARDFAVDFVGFVDPLVGEFQQGDSRSGEVEIRPVAGGPVTVIFVRQLGPDDTWWVLGAATTNITIDEPSALATIESPQNLSGTALAFEGHVNVTLWADGVAEPLVVTFVTGGGDQPRTFEGALEWADPGTDGGALVLTTSGGDDGRIWEAAVTRVLFDGE